MVGKVWDTENKFKLLLTIVKILGPKALPRGEIAAAMGEGYTVESVKQQYSKGIKKGFKSRGATDANGNGSGTPTSAKSTKTTPATKGTGKGRKRKVVTLAVAEDDGEVATIPFAKKSRKMNHEDAAEGDGIDPAVDALGAEVFEAEEDGKGGMDLEHDDLYGD